MRNARRVGNGDLGPGSVREPDWVGRHRAAAELTLRHVGAIGAPTPVRVLAAHVEDVGGVAAALVMGTGVGPLDTATACRVRNGDLGPGSIWEPDGGGRHCATV